MHIWWYMYRWLTILEMHVIFISDIWCVFFTFQFFPLSPFILSYQNDIAWWSSMQMYKLDETFNPHWFSEKPCWCSDYVWHFDPRSYTVISWWVLWDKTYWIQPLTVQMQTIYIILLSCEVWIYLWFSVI